MILENVFLQFFHTFNQTQNINNPSKMGIFSSHQTFCKFKKGAEIPGILWRKLFIVGNWK